MPVDRGDGGVAHHPHDAEQVARVASTRGDVGCAGVAEVEEVGLLPFQRVAEQAARDLDQVIPLLTDIDVREPGRGVGMDEA